MSGGYPERKRSFRMRNQSKESRSLSRIRDESIDKGSMNDTRDCEEVERKYSTLDLS